MDKIYRAGKKLLTILLTAGLLFVLFACQIGGADTSESTDSPEGSASPTPTATEQATDASSETTPAGSESETAQAAETEETDTAAAEATDADEPEPSSGTGAYTITADTTEDGKSYVSESPDENALRVENECTAGLNAATIEKLSGDSSNVSTSGSAGLNAATLLHDGAQLTLTDSDISSDAVGASGAFVYGPETYLIIEDSGIRTSGDASFGIAAADGAIIAAKSLTVSTQGDSSPAIYVAQTGGSISVNGGTFTTGGTDSPAVDTAGNVSAQNATLRANHSAAIAISGGGSVTLNDCTVSGNMAAADDGGGTYTVLLCQSESDGEQDGQCTFIMTGGLINANNGDLFYVTGTSGVISLTNVTLSLSNGVLLRVAGDDEQNGAECSLNAGNQVLTGDILVDDVSSLDLSLTDGTSFTGSINPDGAAGDVSVTLDDDSAWTLTGDAYLSAFSGKTKNIETNGYTVYVNGVAITK